MCQSQTFLPCLVPRFKEQVTCSIPLCCEACNVARASKRSAMSELAKPVPEHMEVIKAEDLKAGECISVDHCQSQV